MATNNSGTITTYKGVINYLSSLCAEHSAIKQFQVGEISDIDAQSNIDPFTRYPLVFAIPQQSTIERGGKTTFGFSLIVADIAKDQEDLEDNVHNNTFMILQDLLGKMALTDYKKVDLNVSFPVSITPFVQRFKNNLAGWTAEIDITIKSPLDLCNAPFN